MEGRVLNRIGCNVGRSSTYYEGVGVWEVAYNGSPAYICRKYFNDIRFACPIFAVNVEAERWLWDVIKVIEEVVEDSVV